MRSDMILHATIPLLALMLLGLTRGRRMPWLVRPTRAVVLIALAGASALFLWFRAQPPSAPAALEPFSLAAAFFLLGWLVLRESIADSGPNSREEPSILPPLVGAAAAVVAGAGAATLALLSRAPAAWLGLLAEPFGQPTIYALSALGGLFARYALASPTFLHVALAACAWFSVARRLATPDGPNLAVMLALFIAAAGIGSSLRRKPA